METPNTPSSQACSGTAGWRIGRRLLLAAAVLFTLAAVFYTVEDWRGRRAWQTCRRELEAKGEVLDWAAYIPAAVPDEQNIFKAPKMQEWFVMDSWENPIGSPQHFLAVPPLQKPSRVVAHVEVVSSAAPLDYKGADAVLRSGDPEAQAQAGKVVRDAVGPWALASGTSLLLATPPDRLKPARLLLRTDAVPAAKGLGDLLRGNAWPGTALASPDMGYLRVAPGASNSFDVFLDWPVSAAEDLAGTERLEREVFEVIRKALERPHARLEGGYQQPFAGPRPHWVALRNAARALAERAQCHLLLGQPEAAWRELALIRGLCRVLEPETAGRQTFLVGAMVDAAITGIYLGVVEDGLRLGAWREPQLAAISEQLRGLDFLGLFVESTKLEGAASCRFLETAAAAKLAKALAQSGKMVAVAQTGKGGSVGGGGGLLALALRCAPRGWFYQNMAASARALEECLGAVDPANHLVHPERLGGETLARLERRSPDGFLAVVAVPNFVRALKRTAQIQSCVDQARVACALERYRLAEGSYPETLEGLAPRFIEKLPRQVVGGQSLIYRRTGEGKFLLYSVGWDGKDHGGVAGTAVDEGDWVYWARPVR